MSSMQRKHAIQSIIRRGQLKQLALDLNMSYSYLSQAFSPATSMNFTNALARKVENALGLAEGRLEQGDLVTVQKDRPRGLLDIALKYRATQFTAFFPDKRVQTNVMLKLGNTEHRAHLVVYNEDGSVFMIAMQSQQYSEAHVNTQLIMLMAISGAHYGVVFSAGSGTDQDENIPGYSPDHKRSQWYQYVQGKITPITYGPDNIFEYMGI